MGAIAQLGEIAGNVNFAKATIWVEFILLASTLFWAAHDLPLSLFIGAG